MRKSIKTRLVRSFMLVIIITVLILEIVLTNSVREYYYTSVEDILTSQIEYSTEFYSRYFSTLDLEDIITDDIDLFWRYTDAQVQILSLDGELLMDSLGIEFEDNIDTSDILKAKDGEKGVWIGNVDYDDHTVMSVSLPLENQDETIGIVRFVTSLEGVNQVINRISALLITMGIVVIIISGIVSWFLANSIVKPLVEVTYVAEKLADGQYKTKSEVKLDDEIGRLSDTLNYMAEEILKREQIKNDFISSISHELRTPLTSIKGWAVTLKSMDVNGDELLNDGLDIIEDESDRLSKMVEDLLDFSRFISGRISLDKELFNLRDTLDMLAIQYTPRANNNDITFLLNIDEKVQNVIADENRIKQVLINLLDNAIKFTPEGGFVKLSAYERGNNIIMEVEDNGVGISEEDLPNVKEKFYSGKNKNATSGIGLSICEEIMKLHEGNIEIKSQVDEGTLVKAILPIEEEEV
ncbi:MAG TPA: HAMP domain-containing sensor histidine kinase [Tissierellaceae bacterium]|nr:HAMP domain-containing sensor histidine kinase [Tissierellaceae bacterium]